MVFWANSHETSGNSRGFGAEGSFSVWLPTHYQWWVGKEKSEKRKKEKNRYDLITECPKSGIIVKPDFSESGI